MVLVLISGSLHYSGFRVDDTDNEMVFNGVHIHSFGDCVIYSKSTMNWFSLGAGYLDVSGRGNVSSSPVSHVCNGS